MASAVEVQHVSKRFRLFQEKYTSFKERIIHAGKVPFHELWALNDINFEVEQGQSLGILGRNGSGKSTLLKCVCGVLQPTSGQVVVRGTLAGLLELGAGFQPELTGRDNIFLNGSLLGLSRREVERKFDEIVAFAELEQFIDNQVKFYSSGMYMRLGFAVAVTVQPDILVVDEVLAVGDERFQRKCMDRIRQFQEEGRSIILVSHSPDQVRSICDHAVVLNGGQLLGVGAPGDMVRLFREALMETDNVLPASETGPGDQSAPEEDSSAPGPFSEPSEMLAQSAETGETASPRSPKAGDSRRRGWEARAIRISDLTARYPEGRQHLQPGEPLTIRVSYEATRRMEGVELTIEFRDDDVGCLYRTDTGIMDMPLTVEPGSGAVDLTVESFPLLDGAYEVAVGLQSRRGGTVYDWRDGLEIKVVNPGKDSGMLGLRLAATVLPTNGSAEPAELPPTV